MCVVVELCNSGLLWAEYGGLWEISQNLLEEVSVFCVPVLGPIGNISSVKRKHWIGPFTSLFHVIPVKDRIFILHACVHMAIELPRKPRNIYTVYFANGNAIHHFT